MDEGRCDGVCIPECRFYPEYGRIGDEEVLGWYEDKLYSKPVEQSGRQKGLTVMAVEWSGNILDMDYILSHWTVMAIKIAVCS